MALAAAAMLPACAIGGADEATIAAEAGPGLPKSLGEPPAPLRPVEIPSPLPPAVYEEPATDTAGGGGSGTGVAGGGGSGTGGGNGGGGGKGGGGAIEPEDIFPPPPPGGQSASTTRIVHLTDAAGDAGEQARYADLLGLAVDDTVDRAVFTVDVGADVPGRLAEGEVMGVGIDVFVGSGTESDYQLFADGSSEGWFAYLDTPDGFIEYPGSFRLGTRRLVFDVPWSAFGSPEAGRISGFADWSRRDAAALNPFSEDFLPDDGNRPFSR